MNLSKVLIKIYAQENVDAPLESYVPAFHRFIQRDSLGEMVFDVADYTHVPKGTGVLLVGHASDYAIDEGEGRPGLLYVRKRDLPEGASLISDALSRLLKARGQVESDAEIKGPKGFSDREVLFRFPERLHVQNDEAGLLAVKEAILAGLAQVIPGHRFSLSREGEARQPLTVRASAQ